MTRTILFCVVIQETYMRSLNRYTEPILNRYSYAMLQRDIRNSNYLMLNYSAIIIFRALFEKIHVNNKLRFSI